MDADGERIAIEIKMFISFVPKELIERIRDNKVLTISIIQKKTKYFM